MGIIDKLQSPRDIASLKDNELAELCGELREIIIATTSKTGGHVSSNLGVVELTVALHRVFDTSRDRLVFDVGHQSYVHKLLTGRKDSFDTLRSFGGLSGFPKPSESVHDAFIAGHASSAISTALGMARARTLKGEDYSVIALLGDGALTGGLAYEGMSDAGGSGEPLIVILNDNAMSITKSVGGLAKYLARERIKKSYVTFKNLYRSFSKKTALGRFVYRVTHEIKKALKHAIFHCSMFEDMGFYYIGPVDGHNIKQLTAAFNIAKEDGGPVLVHVITTKGKGYAPAEMNPDDFHGVSGFNPETGEVKASEKDFSSVFGERLSELAKENDRIVAITAAMRSSTGLERFARQYPNRFFDVGIAEGHAVSMAGGLAESGMIPVFAVYSTFLQRAFDMIIQDTAILREHVVFAVDRAGLVGGDGETHQGIFDISYLSTVPNMTIYSPSSFAELCDMISFAVNNMTTPVAVRYPRGGEGKYRDGGSDDVKIVREGADFTLVTYGISVNTAIDAAALCEKSGVSVEIVKLGRVYPVPVEKLEKSVKKTGRVLVLEEVCNSGCIGEKLLPRLKELGFAPKTFILKNLGDEFVPQGTVDELRRLRGIDAESVASGILDAVSGIGFHAKDGDKTAI